LSQPDSLSVMVCIDLLELRSLLSPEARGGVAGASGGGAIDWQTFPRRLAEEAAEQADILSGKSLEFAGARVYAPLGLLDRAGAAEIAGDKVELREIRSTVAECRACDLAGTSSCHHCRNLALDPAALIAAAIGNDLVRSARDEDIGALVLVTSNTALIPMVRFLERKGKIVVHATVPPRGRDLSAACSAVVDIGKLGGRV
jgi:hypothetical protein